MTRLAVVGSSHMGAVRDCDQRIRVACPKLEITYFGLPGAPFRRARLDEDGVYRIDAKNDAEARMILRINGTNEIDLKPFDLIWLIGPRFGFGRILWLLKTFDVLEMPDTGSDRTISQAFLEAAMRAEIESECAALAARLGAESRITVTPAPYPAETAARKGPHHEPPLAHILRHPARKEIFLAYERMIAEELAKQGFGFVLQPAATRSAPFATDPAFLHGALDFRDTSKQLTDMRHMNADYGFAAFKALCELHPGLGCTIPTTTTHDKG